MASFAEDRQRMVARQIAARGVEDHRVLAALRAVRRHRFVPESVRAEAYADWPLPIGFGQTISQPYIVAVMSEALCLRGDERVLEIGTGSGYQTAVLSELANSVFTVERVAELQERALRVLHAEGCANVSARVDDGRRGWPEEAPFDAILVTAAPPRVPPELVAQLAPAGRLVIPVGPQGAGQSLEVLRKDAQGELSEETLFRVRFVPLL